MKKLELIALLALSIATLFAQSDRGVITGTTTIEGNVTIATLGATTPGGFAAFVPYFAANLADGVVLSNAPDAPHTHWAHRITGVSAARAVLPGETVAVTAWREVGLKYEQLVVDVVS